ncbi:hypothetical protein [Alkaliflexus imshenetskii]|jgi:hypothetical protein|uniref:hypothetical protein n=1 Tax=Alkaliflexus imshenetskii TaxID=286730 RepID=UPI00047D0939|nr:hypothetical protein [Alkaliflexus imshenetskii]
MKGKKLPKKNSGVLYQDEDTLRKSGVKLSKQKRSKKPSIYDEMDDVEDEYASDNDFDDYYENDMVNNEDEDDDLY